MTLPSLGNSGSVAGNAADLPRSQVATRPSLGAHSPLSTTRFIYYREYKRHKGGSFDSHPHQTRARASCTALQLQPSLMHVQNEARCTGALHLGTRLRGLKGPDTRDHLHTCLTICMLAAAARQKGAQRCSRRHHESQPVSKGTPGGQRAWSARAGCGAKGRRSPRY